MLVIDTREKVFVYVPYSYTSLAEETVKDPIIVIPADLGEWRMMLRFNYYISTSVFSRRYKK